VGFAVRSPWRIRGGTQPKTNISPDNGTEVKTLHEDFDSFSRLQQRLGAPAASDYLAAPTEVVQKDEVQRWMIFNLTSDMHPMHFHLLNVTVRKWEALEVRSATGNPVLPLQAIPGTTRPADPNEQGSKETVRMNPGEVVMVDMKFDLPEGLEPPPSPRLLTNYGFRGAENVWHCHILEREEHDMMRTARRDLITGWAPPTVVAQTLSLQRARMISALVLPLDVSAVAQNQMRREHILDREP
jgi:spore coat protein A